MFINSISLDAYILIIRIIIIIANNNNNNNDNNNNNNNNNNTPVVPVAQLAAGASVAAFGRRESLQKYGLFVADVY